MRFFRPSPKPGPQPCWHLLVVEDEPVQRAIFTGTLQQAGHVVEGAKDGDEALDLIEQAVFDCIVLDWLLPGLAGADFIRVKARIERLLGRAWTPVLLMSVNERAREGCKNADGYLQKPVRPEALVGAISATITGSADQ